MDETDPLYAVLIKTILLVDDSNNRFFQQFNLGTTRYYALWHIHNTPGISLSDLSERLLCTKGNATRIIRSLENDGLVGRAVDETDNRAARLTLSAEGEMVFERVRQAYASFSHNRFECLDPAAKTALQQYLETFNTHLSRIIQAIG
jgi:DNA-binding MarR family transcriptional regulator